jgi:type II secretory pathway component PulJ
MADPFSIVSLAAAIAQFIDIGFRLIHDAKEVYDSTQGARQDLAELRIIVDDIKLLNQDIRCTPSPRPLSKDDLAICALADQCDAIADCLLSELAPLEIQKGAKYRVLESVRVSIAAFTKRNDVRRLWERLSLVEKQLRERVARATQREQHSSIMLILESLRREIDKAGDQTLDKIADLKDSIVFASAPTSSNSSNGYVLSLGDLQSALTNLVQQGQFVDHRRKVIESLMFKSMTRRHGQINTAHFETLGWALDESETTLYRWLTDSNGIYWVSGLVRPYFSKRTGSIC